MESRKWIQALIGMGAVAGLACAILLPLPLEAAVSVGLLALAGGVGFVLLDRERMEAESRDQLIRMINHHRHDWMNELQVLFGYIRLKKYDNLPDYMDKIKTTALHDSYLSKLGVPALIVYFLGFRVENGPMALEIEIEQEIDLRKLALDENVVFRLIRGITEQFRSRVESGSGEASVLSIGFDQEEGVLLLDFVFQGMLNPDGLKAGVGSILRKVSVIEIKEESYGDESAEIAIAIPFRR